MPDRQPLSAAELAVAADQAWRDAREWARTSNTPAATPLSVVAAGRLRSATGLPLRACVDQLRASRARTHDEADGIDKADEGRDGPEVIRHGTDGTYLEVTASDGLPLVEGIPGVRISIGGIPYDPAVHLSVTDTKRLIGRLQGLLVDIQVEQLREAQYR